MKKSDLKSGMVVSLRDWKEKFIFIQDVFCSTTGKDFLELSNYDDDLKHNFNDRFDITEVYKNQYPNIMSCFLGNRLELIWEREKEIDWSKVPFGAKVRVWDSGLKDKYEGRFLEYVPSYENYPFRAYTEEYKETFLWECCELIEEPKEELTGQNVQAEYSKHCELTECKNCKYSDDRTPCFETFIINNYNITRK